MHVYTAAAYSIQMYRIVKIKSLKRCNSCLESKFSQQTNLSMKISILGSISAENEDKRSMKITLEIMLHVTKYHEGEPIYLYKFSIVLRKCNYRDSSQIYKQHFNRFINIYSNIVGHVHGPTLKRPPYCVHKYFIISCPNTCSVAISQKSKFRVAYRHFAL